MNPSLADYPAIPPFPSFTDFEKQALACISEQFGSDEQAFRDQIAASKVVDRINTIVGFYTRVFVDRSLCRPLPVGLKGEHFEVDQVQHGVGIVLWEEDGYLETIEGFTYDDDPFEGRDLANLKFLRLVQLG